MLMAQVGEQPCVAYGALPVQMAPSQPPVPSDDSPPYVAASGPLAAVDMTVHSIFIASEYRLYLYCLSGLIRMHDKGLSADEMLKLGRSLK